MDEEEWGRRKRGEGRRKRRRVAGVADWVGENEREEMVACLGESVGGVD